MQSNIRQSYGAATNRAWNKDGMLTLDQTLAGNSYYRSFACERGLASRDPVFRKAPNDYSYAFREFSDMHYIRNYADYAADYGSTVGSFESNRIEDMPWNQSTVGFLSSDWISEQAQVDKTLSKIFDELALGKSNLIVDFAERKDTIRMIRNCLNVRKLAKTMWKEVLSSKKRASASTRLKYATDKWLEYRYGWLPLVSSTYELLETLSKDLDAATSTKMTKRVSWSRNETRTFSEPGGFGPRKVTLSIEATRRCEIGGRFDAPKTLSIWDFTSLNPLGIAWELLPLSFVADWFVTVGATMELWENYIKYASTFQGGYITYTQLEKAQYHGWYEAHGAPLLYPNGSQVGGDVASRFEQLDMRRKFCIKRRELLPILPRPGGPRVDVKLNPQRLLDACSLLRGALVGNPKIRAR